MSRPAPSTAADAAGAAIDDALLERVRRSLAATAQAPTPARVAAALRAVGAVLGDATVLEITDRLRADISGIGPLDALIRAPGVTDVLVNAPGEVWVDRGHGLTRASVRFRDEAEVRALARRLAASAGRRLDDAVPFVDARLAGGVRLHAVLPPIAPDGTLVSLRIPALRPFVLDDLVRSATVAPGLEPWLRAIVEFRLAFLVSGGTGAGKTTVLAALLAAADPGERIILVEDSGELRPSHAHVLRLEARAPNVEGVGRVGLDDLVRQALRMRPDRLVVGEVRGAEIIDLLAALNTGHEGGCGTIHANSADDVPARMEALGIAAGLPRDAVAAQAVSAIDVVLHLVRDAHGRRRVSQLRVLVPSAGGGMRMEPAFDVDEAGVIVEGGGADVLRDALGARGWSS
ncbi:MAG TPA: TadA family conjugal transfer-associated ATPase [Jiangellaceae bacterium]